jgi:hypothetical protein
MKVIDTSYVRMAGEDVRARLFPVPKADGRVPIPLPVALAYSPEMENGPTIDVLFVRENSIQRAVGIPDDVAEGAVFVVVGSRAFHVILEFDEEPKIVPSGVEVDDRILALLRAVTGISS